MELTFQTGAFRQRIQRLLVVIQGLQTLFHLVEVDGVQIAALRCGGERHVQRGHIVRQLVLRVDDVVEFGGQHRPSAVRNEHVPLFGLLGHHEQRLMQVLHLGTDA